LGDPVGQVIAHIPPCEPLQDLQEFVNGNGKKGAKERLGLLERDVDEIKSNINKSTGAIITAAVTLIVGVLLWIFTTLIPAAIKLL